MDLAVKDDVKSNLTKLKDEIIQETIEKTFWQLAIKRDNWVVVIRQRESLPFCDVSFAQNYQGDDLIKLKGFMRDFPFLLELRKLITSPKVSWYTNLKENELTGYIIIQRCFINSNVVDIADLDASIRSVINYGVLALTFIGSKIRKEASEQQSTDHKTLGSEENRSYS
jgi:hypothetical protein